MYIQTSLEGKFLFILTLICGLSLALGYAILYWLDNTVAGIATSLLLVLVLLVFSVRMAFKSVNHTLQALSNTLLSYQDQDFSISIANTRRDELGKLITQHNKLGDLMRRERQNVYQRELLLDTIIQTTPLAILLTNQNGRVVYSNAAAGKLLQQKALDGLELSHLIAIFEDDFIDVINSDNGGMCIVNTDDIPEIYHLTKSEFTLNAQLHHLYVFKHMTHELNRREVAIWKKVIRVISHELNNSLAPIASLANSGKALVQKKQLEKKQPDQLEGNRLNSLFESMSERADYLKSFIEGYAQFARLPLPKVEEVHIRSFLQSLTESAGVEFVSSIQIERGFFDPVQLQQVLINLLKNATEAGSPTDQIKVTFARQANNLLVTVQDRGSGMSADVLVNALLPFYSTKKTGTGLGLSLCREIAEAHNGRIAIHNREGGGLVVKILLPDKPQSAN